MDIQVNKRPPVASTDALRSIRPRRRLIALYDCNCRRRSTLHLSLKPGESRHFTHLALLLTTNQRLRISLISDCVLYCQDRVLLKRILT